MDSSISGEMVEMLRHCNTTLQQIKGLKYKSVNHQRQIRQLLLRNRNGADFVANATKIPMEHWGDYWGDLLMGIGNEECNFVVTELVKRRIGSKVRGNQSPRLRLVHVIHHTHHDDGSSSTNSWRFFWHRDAQLSTIVRTRPPSYVPYNRISAPLQ